MAGPGQSHAYDLTRNKNKGVALILVNQNFEPHTGFSKRRGAGGDFNRLQQCFGDLGFDVDAHFDQTGLQILSHVQRVSKLNHADNACLVLAISSHGDRYVDSAQLRQKDSVVGTDGIPVSFYSLTKHFQEGNCPSLKDKPKMLFIQCCRGERLSEEATVEEVVPQPAPGPQEKGSGDGNAAGVADDSDWGGLSKLTRSNIIYSDDIPLHRDFLLACSIPPDFFAFHNMNGSWFIVELCNVLAEKHKDCDLMRVLSEVNWRVATQYATSTPSKPAFNERRIMPWVASMLRKEVYL